MSTLWAMLMISALINLSSQTSAGGLARATGHTSEHSETIRHQQNGLTVQSNQWITNKALCSCTE